jgi:hypothetical protein
MTICVMKAVLRSGHALGLAAGILLAASADSHAATWTGTVADGWCYVSDLSGNRLSTLGILPGVQTDNNDALTNGCYAVRSSSGNIGGKQWFSVLCSGASSGRPHIGGSHHR